MNEHYLNRASVISQLYERFSSTIFTNCNNHVDDWSTTKMHNPSRVMTRATITKNYGQATTSTTEQQIINTPPCWLSSPPFHLRLRPWNRLHRHMHNKWFSRKHICKRAQCKIDQRRKSPSSPAGPFRSVTLVVNIASNSYNTTDTAIETTVVQHRKGQRKPSQRSLITETTSGQAEAKQANESKQKHKSTGDSHQR